MDQQGQFDTVAALKAGYNPDEIVAFMKQKAGVPDSQPSFQGGQSIFGGYTPSVSENFGQSQPDLEVFSNGMTNGTGLAAPEGTPVGLPPGEWQVLDSYSQAQGPGYIGNGENSGYGNSALVQNTKTGEKLRFSHLSENNLPRGYTFQGGVPFGKIGSTGNTTGPHLNLEYYDPFGQIGDVLKSPYASYLGVKGEQN